MEGLVEVLAGQHIGGARRGRGSATGSSSGKRRGDLVSMIQPSLFTRPQHVKEDKTGVTGRPLDCLTNYIEIKTTPDWNLYQYHVHFDPPVDSKFVRGTMIAEQSEVLGKERIFDGMILYLPKKLEPSTKILAKHSLIDQEVTITLKLTAELEPSNPQCLTLYNLICRTAFQKLKYRQIGRHYYNPESAHEISRHKIEIWPGVISAIRCHEDELLMCCEMSHKVLRTDTVLQFMKELYQRNIERFQEVCTQTLLGMSVVTRYNNRIYKIDDIMWDMRPTNTFELADGETKTFVDYYKEQHRREIKDMAQPLLYSRAKRRGTGDGPSDMDVYIVPELAAMTGLTDQMRNDRRVMQDLAEFTRVQPEKRIRFSRDYLNRMIKSPEVQSLLESWGLRMGEDVASLTARVLPAEMLFGGKKAGADGGAAKWQTNATTADWSRESRDQPLLLPKPLDNWLLIYPKGDGDKAESFYNTARNIGSKIGVDVQLPRTFELADDGIRTYLEAIEHAMNGKMPSIVVVIVPNDNKTRYDAIKKLVCHDRPVPSQVVRSQTLTKNILSVSAKILLQMICKLGGSLWRAHIPMSNAMVIGYDVYQDSANRGKVVGAAVFSLDGHFTRWYSQCALHGDSRDQITNLTEFCKNGLLKYYDVNDKLPDRIFLYRDGCGDGQIPVVVQNELPQLQEAIKVVGSKAGRKDYKPRLLFTIVTKRVNSRYFEKKANGEFSSPPPGTVVDTRITRPERYDFLMVPQSVRQGTVTPVCYNVVFDESELKADQLQRLTYKLCHLYYNWQGTVRVPAPCQYAHKLAFLVGQSLHRQADDTLADKLYFL